MLQSSLFLLLRIHAAACTELGLRQQALLCDRSALSPHHGDCREFGLLVKQMLYFDRYVRLLAPELEVLQDSRVSFSDLSSRRPPPPAATIV